jgi:hypothetical protein
MNIIARTINKLSVGIIDRVDKKAEIRTIGTSHLFHDFPDHNIAPGMNKRRTLAVAVGQPRNEYVLGIR